MAGADHPRSRGVYKRSGEILAPTLGSSPLARGLLVILLRRTDRRGIIPARAGFTAAPGCGRRTGWDHPRSRGVYAWEASARAPALGSSPLARGLPDDGEVVMRDRGIIPARAGFTSKTSRCRGRGTDHPRSRGVYVYFRRDRINVVGSSPLARGLPRGSSGISPHHWIIPARAGFTGRSPT
mgnify:CR=1 FL=1